MAVTTGFQGRTFDVPRTCVPCIDPPRRAPCAAADAVFADAKAFLSSSEARQMSESELERELHRRGQELVRKLLQGHRDQRSPKEAAGPAEGKGTSGVECSEPREHESHAETASGTMQVVGLGCARRGHDGLHRLDAALNLGISEDVDRRFRRNWITDFGGSGSPIPVEVDRFRRKWITRFPGVLNARR